MRCVRHRAGLTWIVVLLGCAGLLLQPRDAGAQIGQQPGQGGNQQQGGAVNGITIDAEGVVRPQFVTKKADDLARKRLESAAADSLPSDMTRQSKLRKVSLVRLEAACREHIEQGEPVPSEMVHLAGLQRLQYVFVYPEKQDLVIAGPAEGFAADASGRMVGVSTGMPPLRLDDLLVALRSVGRNGRIGCSIDPRPNRLAALKRYVASNTGATTPSVARNRFRKMRDILGMQDVKVFGVDPQTHFAATLVEADYRMKLISVGLENSQVRGLPSHLSLLQGGGNSMQRWWFTPLYDAFYTTGNGDAFRFSGQRCQLMSRNEFVNDAGQRSDAAFTRVTTQRFARLFTEKFPELAARKPIFAELQNLFDLAVLAALLEKQQLPEKIGWDMSLFLDSQKAEVVKGHPPREVPSVVNTRRARRGLIVGLIGGGVTITPMETLRTAAFRTDTAERLSGIRTAAQSETAESHPWWWD